MRRHEDFRAQAFDRIQCLEPVEAVTVVDIDELLGEKQLAQIGDAILRNIDDAVAARVPATQIANLDLLAAEIERDPIPKGLVGEPRFLLFRRHLVALHQRKKIAPVAFVPFSSDG